MHCGSGSGLPNATYLSGGGLSGGGPEAGGGLQVKAHSAEAL